MKVYNHCAGVLREITDKHKNKGFKSGFYDYYEDNKQDIGSQMNRLYSMAINCYK